MRHRLRGLFARGSAAEAEGESVKERTMKVSEGFLGHLLALASELAAESDLDVRMERLCFHTRSLLDCDRSSIFLRDGDAYVARSNSGNPPEVAEAFPNHRVPLDDPLVMRAIETRRVVTVNDASNDPLMSARTARAANIHAIVVAPIFDRHQRAAGFITAEFNERKMLFRVEEAQLFGAIANIIALSIERDEAEREDEAVRTRLKRASHMAALGRFAQGLARDFNNRLTAIIGISDLLVERSRGTDTEEMLEELVRSVEGAAELTQHLLAISSDRRDEKAACDAGFLFRSIASLLRPLIRSDIDLVVASDVRSGFIGVSEIDLQRILSNLVMNAAQASQPGDTVRVSLEHVVDGEAVDEEAARPASGRALAICVEDRGHGIDPTQLEEVLTPFHTTLPDGVGLGLAIVVSLVEAASGRVELNSTPGVGTRVRILLPEVEPQLTQLEPAEPVSMQSGRQVTVLIVDDDESIRRVIRRTIEQQAHRVLEAADGLDALRVASESDAPIDVLITDVVMPHMDGIDLAHSLVGLNRKTKVVFTSGYAPDFRSRLGDDFDSYVFLPKPFSPSRIVDELEMLVARSSPLH